MPMFIRGQGPKCIGIRMFVSFLAIKEPYINSLIICVITTKLFIKDIIVNDSRYIDKTKSIKI